MTCRNYRINGVLIAGVFTLCLFFILGISVGQTSDIADSLNSYKELQSNFNHDQQKSSSYQPAHPSPIIYPSSGRDLLSPFGNMPSASPTNEKIALDGNHSQVQVKDIKAINSIKQRSIVYDDVQRGDADHPSNSADIKITGTGQGDKDAKDQYDNLGRTIEENADKGLASGMNGGQDQKTASAQSKTNNLNIDVSGISVSAINTVKGGSATATSNIIIEPVQTIIDSCEASEKLK
jgi:hypothetical protein